MSSSLCFEKIEECVKAGDVEAAWKLIQCELNSEWVSGELVGRVPWRMHNSKEVRSNTDYYRKGLYVWANASVPQYIGITTNKRGFRGRFNRYVGGEKSTIPELAIATLHKAELNKLAEFNTLELTRKQLSKRYSDSHLPDSLDKYVYRLEHAERYVRCGTENICFLIIPSRCDNITSGRLTNVEGNLVQYVNNEILPPNQPLLNREHAGRNGLE